MTTAIMPAHGQRRCYLAGCRRPECATAHYRYMSKLRLDQLQGKPRRIDATQTRTHIQRLQASGWTQAQITRVSGLSHHRIVGSILKGQATVSCRTALAIYSVPIGPPPGDHRDVDATGTTRRVRALVAIGWPIARLAPMFGLYETALGIIARGEREQVRATTAARIAREYRRLSGTPGINNRARNDARRNGWHGPLAWGDNIDNPQALPDTADAYQPLHPNSYDPYRRSEIEHLLRSGASSDEIHKRTGASASYITQIRTEMRASRRRPLKSEQVAA